MDALLGFAGGLTWLFVIVVLAVIAIAAFIFIRTRYKIADANQALVITGGKGEPKILVGGGAFVPPFRTGKFFDLGLKTVSSTNEATHTNTMIPVIVEWTAQLRADTSKEDTGELNQSLRNAILGFTNYHGNIADSLQQTLEGEVRAAIATMTPEDLVRNKAGFTEQVDTKVRDSMAELGFKLVSLNIGKITDPNGYYDNLAARDREEKRREAEILVADADRGIAVKRAEADEASKGAEQKRDLAIAEQNRDLALRKAAIKVETDTAEANAEVAGQLQKELRNQELAEREGQVAVVREEQAQAAATARRQVEVTQAETAKQKKEIEASADARQAEINAQAAAAVVKAQAIGAADAAKATAQGEADAIGLTTRAKADQIRETGQAEADAAEAKGKADASAILARGSAEAEAQRLMAEALAANEGANLRVTLAEIESKTRITVATQVGQVMADFGQNAKIIDLGGGTSEGGTLFERALGGIPKLLAQLDVQSDALQGSSFGDSLGALLASVTTGSPTASNGTPAIDTTKTDETEAKPAETDAVSDAPATQPEASFTPPATEWSNPDGGDTSLPSPEADADKITQNHQRHD